MLALVLIAHFAVEQQDGKVNGVKVGDRGVESGRKAPRQPHEPVAQVVDVPCDAPIARGHETGAGSGFDVFDVLETGVVGVVAERVLLVVGAAEQGEPEELHGDDSGSGEHAEVLREKGQIACLERVGKRYPGKVAKSEHVAKAVHDYIHRREDRGFVPKRIDDIVCLEDNDEPHRVREPTKGGILFGRAGKVQNEPANEAGAQLKKDLEVKVTDPRVQLATDPEIVDKVPRVTSQGKEPTREVRRLVEHK